MMQTFEISWMEPLSVPVTTAVTLEDDDDNIENLGCTYKEAKGTIHSTQKQSSTSIINNLKMQPSLKFQLHIPLCLLISMPLVCPTMWFDVKRLEAELAHGYYDGDCVFYVSLVSIISDEKDVRAQD